MQINIDYDSSVTNAPAAFKTDVNIAVQYLESLFTNPITITIDVGYGEIAGQSLSAHALGESEPAINGQAGYVYRAPYSSVRSALVAENAPGSSTLPATSPFSGDLLVTSAEAKALGLAANGGGIDGYVGFSSSAPFSYANNVTPPSNEYYFIGVVEHEITEDMGRVSLLDNQPSYYSTMDLYRWSSPGVRDTTTGGAGYFSIDDGSTNLGTWNNQTNNGDFGDWYPAGPAPNGDDAFNDYSSPGIIDVVSSGDVMLMEALGYAGAFSINPSNNASPSAAIAADMIMSNPANGDYEIYNVSGNTVLAAYSLIQVQSPWAFAALGSFQTGDSIDMLLRNTSTGAFEANYINGNTVTSWASVGTVGLNWAFAGVGDFDGASSLSEILLRNSGSGAFGLYQFGSGGALSGSAVAAIGNNFQVMGHGEFSESSTTQLLMQDSSGDASNGQLELYTYQPSTASFAGVDVGDIGSNLTALGCADLLGNGSTQLVMQQNNGALWLYSYNAGAFSGGEVGAVGSNFHVVGFGPLGSAGQDEMLMQNASGAFEVYQYNASENAFVGTSMGAVGSPWVVDGIADPPAVASTAQLVQAMASMSGGAGLSTASSSTVGPETTTPTLLAVPQPG